MGWVVMLFTALERGRIPFCIFLAIAFTWWAELLTAILIQQLGSVFQIFRNKALEQVRQRPRPHIKSPVCWEGEMGDTERICWTVPGVLGWCCWRCAQPELQPPLLCSVPRALSPLLPSWECVVLLQVTQSVVTSLVLAALCPEGEWRVESRRTPCGFTVTLQWIAVAPPENYCMEQYRIYGAAPASLSYCLYDL